MRIAVATAVACLTVVGLSAADEVQAAIRKHTTIPAQGLGPALQQLANERNVQLVYRSEVVGNRQTGGASGELTFEEALLDLLDGTGLTFKYLEDKAITIVPLSTSSSFLQGGDAKGSAQSLWERVRLAQGLAQEQAQPVATENPTTPAPTAASPATTSSAAPAAGEVLQEILVTGSQIRGAAATDVLAVTVIGTEEIRSGGAVSGEDLYRSIPQAGDVGFNTQTLRGGSAGAARGDVSSINLRGIGPGNTLVLLNGRRIVQHPTTQGSQEVTYNANTIPVGALERLEVLRDGAAAIYGSDAVAGVVNNVLRSDFSGFDVDAQHGGAEGTNLRQLTLNALWGQPFASGRGNITTYLGFTQDSKLYASDQDYTASADRRRLLEGTSFAGNLTFDPREAQSPWGAFQAPASVGIVGSNGVALTNASGVFHVQPATNSGCQLAIGNGLCLDDGAVTTAADRNLRYDQPRAVDGYTVTPGVERINAFSFINFEINDAVSFFGELGYYHAKTETLSFPLSPLSATPITIPAANYYNPFGPITSPNRLPGLNIPDSGVPLTLLSYSIADAGPRRVEVESDQYRILAGLRGQKWGWDWESAALYSGASSKDSADGISNTLFQQALARSTPDAYNPFNGGDLANPSLGDPTPSNDVSSFLITSVRDSEATLALWDLKLSKPDLFALPAGPVGIALGTEVRREESQDDRDDYGDFSTPFIDMVTGVRYDSDALGASAAWDVSGKRTVYSAYLEFGVPIVSSAMNIPLVNSLDFQIAGRYENYSDVGDVAKPKLAVAWSVFDGVLLRSSWSQGFKAPTLEQLVPVVRPTAQARLDDVLCEADLRAGRISNFGACNQRPNVQRFVAGNADLKPEESESFSYGLVFETPFLPAEYGELTLTIDHWKIEQEGRVSFVSAENALTLDYLRRVQGSFNPDVERNTPTPEDIAFVAGTGLAPIGSIIGVHAQYDNLEPRTVEGIDFGLFYDLSGTSLGDFRFNLNVARTLDYFQSPSALQLELLDAQAAGIINAAAVIGGAADLIEEAGQPKWKGSALLSWSGDRWGAGVSSNYVGRVFERNASNSSGEPWEVKALLTMNLYGEYRFTEGFAADTSVRLGVRNVGDKDPPLAINGYLGNLYQPYARYWYLNLRKRF